jgi:hypothetical protein
MSQEEFISSGASEAADALTEIIEPFEKLRNALIRVYETKIAGSDEQVEILQRQAGPALHKIARDLRADRRLKKLRSLAANCRPQLQEAYEAVTMMEKALRG